MKHLEKAFIESLLIIFLFIAGCDFKTKNKIDPNIKDNFDPEWAQNPIWDDGQAEVAVYDAEKIIYNKIRKFEYVFVTAKEDFNKEFNVKSDGYDREDLFPVIKVNQFARIQTDNYPYHFLTSLYFKRENPTTLFKMTIASQEWCGNTFKEFLLKEGGYVFHYHSYFDGEGDGEELINEYPVLFEDQLIYTLRTLIFKEGLSFERKVISSQISNRAIHPKIYEAVFEVKKDEIKQDTSHVSCWRIDVKLEQDKLNQYFFAEEYPNIPLQYVSWDERKLKLKGFDRYAYWKR